MTFRVVVTGFNCERWAARCLQSIVEARGQHELFIYVINDGSTDRTQGRIATAINNLHKKFKFIILNFGVNRGAAFARWRAIELMRGEANPEDVVLFVDLDDFILPNCLNRIAEAYEKQGAAITYGNWQDSETGETFNLQYYPEELGNEKRWCNVPFYATAPRSAKWRLVAQLRAEDFIYEGVWLPTCTDVALMYALFDLTPFSTIVPIAEPLYVYRRNTGNNSLLRFGFSEKIRIADLIIKRCYANNPHYRT